jgi:branched-chain amino acid transport system permease protein
MDGKGREGREEEREELNKIEMVGNAVKSYKEFYRKKRRIKLAEFSILATILIFAPFVSGFYLLWLITLGVIYSTYTLAWNWMETMIGRTSLGHAIPFGLAGYLSALLYIYTKNPLLFPLTWIVAGMLSASVLYILSLSRDRVAFVFISFLIGAIIWIFSPLFTITMGGEIYGGEEGFSLPSNPILVTYSLSVVLLLAVFLFFGFLRTSATGLKFTTVRDDERAARLVGVKVNRVKAFCTLISCIITALAGGLYALHFSHVNPEVFSIHIALFPFIATIFFKNDSEIGGVTGSFILVFVSNYLNSIFPQLHLLLYSALLIVSPGIIRWRARKAKLTGGV